MIICGFAGIGKSYMCKHYANWIDLESTPFEKDFERYVKVAQHMDKQGYNVMLSCHGDLRKLLHEKGIEYTLVVPKRELKEEYINRYKNRGNTESFIKNLNSNWDKFCKPYEFEKVVYLDSNDFISTKFVV